MELAARPRLTTNDLNRLEQRLETLESQSRHAAFLLGCDDGRKLGDAYVSIRLVAGHGAALDGVERLAKMYQGLAKRRGLEVEVLSDRRGGEPAEDAILLFISGAGSFALLSGEAGLHQFLRGQGKHNEGKRRTVDREAVRVEVLPAPPAEVEFPRDEVKVEAQPLRHVEGRLLPRPRFDLQLLHVPTAISVRAWTDGSKTEAIAKLRPLLRARIETAQNEPAKPAQPAVVRRYTLGPAPRVRDLRSGRATGRLGDVLAGHLEPFLTLPEAECGG
jgi:protein subunit release factor A